MRTGRGRTALAIAATVVFVAVTSTTVGTPVSAEESGVAPPTDADLAVASTTDEAIVACAVVQGGDGSFTVYSSGSCDFPTAVALAVQEDPGFASDAHTALAGTRAQRAEAGGSTTAEDASLDSAIAYVRSVLASGTAGPYDRPVPPP